MIGIYVIKCNQIDKIYIGSSKNIFKRFNRHKKDLENNKHHNIYLQRAYLKYGKETFEFEVIEETFIEELREIEQMYLDCLDFKFLFNISKSSTGGDLISNHPLNFEFRKLQSKLISERNAKLTKSELKEKFGQPGILNGMYGKKHTEETKNILSIKAKDYHKNNPNPMLGKSLSKEARKKISIASSKRTGNKNSFYGKTHTEENKNKMKLARLGRIPTNAKVVLIDGFKYASIEEASRKLSIPPTTISYRCKSSSFLNYKIMETSND